MEDGKWMGLNVAPQPVLWFASRTDNKADGSERHQCDHPPRLDNRKAAIILNCYLFGDSHEHDAA
jgi:hypothetical protein